MTDGTSDFGIVVDLGNLPKLISSILTQAEVLKTEVLELRGLESLFSR